MLRRDAWRSTSEDRSGCCRRASTILALGSLLSRVNVRPGSPLAFQGTADDARALLIGISSTMVTVIALLLGLAVVALQLSSTQFSPRLLRNFLRDRPNQIVLSVFVGTFAYAAGGLFEVGISAGQRVDEFPRFAVTVAVALLFVSLALLVFFADHLAHSIQVDHILRVVERTTLPVIRNLPPTSTAARRPAACGGRPDPTVGLRAVRQRRETARRGRGRAGQRVLAALGRGARRGRHAAGVGVAGRAPPIWRPRQPACPEAPVAGPLTAAVRIGFERTLEQDPGLGLRQLIDPACKALSPAVNDPYTAIQAIEHLPCSTSRSRARPVGAFAAQAKGAMSAIPARSFAEHYAGHRTDPPLRGRRNRPSSRHCCGC